MAFNAASVDAVADAAQEIQFLRGIIAAGTLSVADLPQAALTDAERDAIRVRLSNRVQNRRSFIINEVGTW